MSKRISTLLAGLLCCAWLPGADPVAVLELGPGVPVNRMLQAINENWVSGSADLADPAWRKAVSALRPGALRFPGGTSASFWDWRTGRFVDAAEIDAFGNQEWSRRYRRQDAGLATTPVDAVRFGADARAVGAGTLWVFNLATRDAAHQIGLVDRLVEAGQAPGWAELGNEYHHRIFARRFPGGSPDYLRQAASLAAHLRARVPGVRIGVIANRAPLLRSGEDAVGGEAADDGDAWNAGLLAGRAGHDAWIVHSYGFNHVLLRGIAAEHWAEAALAFPGAAVANGAEASRARFGGVPLWLTEVDIGYHKLKPRLMDGGPSESWLAGTIDGPLQALHAAGWLIAAINEHDIWQVIAWHALTGERGFGLLRREQGIITANAAAQVLAHLATVSAGAQRMHPVAVRGGRPLGFTLLGRADLAALAAAAYSGPDGTTLLLLNRGGVAQSWRMASPASGHALHWTALRYDGAAPVPPRWAVDPAATIPWPGPLQVERETGDWPAGSDPTGSVPPRSLVVLHMRLLHQ